MQHVTVLAVVVAAICAGSYRLLPHAAFTSLDHSQPSDVLRIWWLVCAMLVFLMQVGFLLLETGYVRVKNMSGIAVKSFMMLLASSFVFSWIGARLMYSNGALIGWSPLIPPQGAEWLFYQTGFAAVAATILSGAIAERTTLKSNVVASVALVAVAYPLYGHWVWSPSGWLHNLGMHDFAGSGVVHFVGGVTALVGAWVAGPRRDKYDPPPPEIREDIGTRSLPLATVGVIFLWIGWIGFNGGNIKNGETAAAGTLVLATCVAASAGGFAVVVAAPLRRFLLRRDRDETLVRFLSRERQVDPFLVLPGVMGGMVAVTACCDLLPNHLAAIPVGLVGGAATFFVSLLLRSRHVFRRFQIDDPVDAIAVHAGAGAAGILVTGLFPQQDMRVQLLGLLAAGAVTSLIMGATFVTLDRIRQLRSSVFEEQVGLTFEVRLERPAEFPLKTSYVAVELRQDIRSFLQMLVTRPAHNLRTFAELLPAAYFRHPEYRQAVQDAVLNEVKHLVRLAKLEQSPEPFSLRDVVHSICEECRVLPTLGLSNGWLIEQAGEVSERYLVVAHRDMVADVVKTMLANSSRWVAMKQADRVAEGEAFEPRVVCDLKRRGDQVSLSVSDNGPGVPAEVRAQMFEPFNKREGGHGFGLGLFYAALVAETFCGQLILWRSDPDRGTSFELLLPGPSAASRR